MSRIDLTNWIIHFVHERKVENEGHNLLNSHEDNYDGVPTNFSYKGKPDNQIDEYEEQDYGL